MSTTSTGGKALSCGDEDRRHAAELIAFDVLDPALRSRGIPRREATALKSDSHFRQTIQRLLSEPPAGRFTPPRLPDLANRLADLERPGDRAGAAAFCSKERSRSLSGPVKERVDSPSLSWVATPTASRLADVSTPDHQEHKQSA
jgi:hypothetical protein